VLVVLHDLNLAAQYATRLVLMKTGAIVADGLPSDVLTETRIGEVFGVRATVIRNPLCDAPAVFVGL
jgi:iron complex transport system ATP-binding protein